MAETGETLVLDEAKKEVELKSTPPNIFIFTDKEKGGLAFAKTIERMKIAAPGVREVKLDQPTYAHFTEPEIVYIARNGAYWSGYIGFVFNENDVLSSHQYFDGGATGIRLFDPEYDGKQNLKPAVIDLNEHHFLLILDGDVYTERLTTIQSVLVKNNGLALEQAEKWIGEHIVPLDEILSEAKKFCLDYFGTEEGGKDLGKIIKRYNDLARRTISDPRTKERLLELTTDRNALVRNITGDGYHSHGTGIMHLFQTPLSTDLLGVSPSPEIRPVENLLKKHMVNWLRERHFDKYKDKLPKGQFKAVESGNFYGEVPLKTLRSNG